MSELLLQYCLQVRPLYLHRYGGIYADLDFAALRPADELLLLMQNSSILLGRDCGLARPGDECNKYDQRLPNAFMISVPHHSFWLFAMHGILRGIWQHGVDAPIAPAYISTGPAPLAWAHEAYMQYIQNANYLDDIIILGKEIYPFSWTEHRGSYSLGCCFDDKDVVYNGSCCQALYPEAYVISFWSGTWA